ncbi:SYF2 splicing factor-domain-containing protein [Echria macrotheca]|uniref:Pre-mRNA-splicing factor SYF2 n=1 Tax=Echria macrotheca TaxID=438768 RepID=A0AAJ0B302_9PEZI|nr:SYF2 splicing factor-domain-containing protein [Echria macrotheca]
MPAAKKRRAPPAKKSEPTEPQPTEPEPQETEPTETQPATTTENPSPPTQEPPQNPPQEPEMPSSSSSSSDAAARAKERMSRFRALQERAKTSSTQNLKEATRESQRLAADPNQLTALSRKHAIASHKLLRAEVEESGGDFERKRAWDWTAEESEKWDRRVRKKESHRDDTAFRDYGRESEKAYKRNLQKMGAPDLERYTRDKLAAVERAAAAGTLEIVETDDGDLIAVDKDGTFYSAAESTTFAEHKPDRAAVDRLVESMKKAEEAALKKRRERMAANKEDDGGDVTYINEKNKQFNQKLARFYNKYTAEIRESFERGTMI